MWRTLALAWRMHRWEATFFIGGGLLLAAVMVFVAWQLDASRELLVSCYDQPFETLSAQCRSAIDWGNILSGAIGILGAIATFAPFAAGIFLGAPLVSREIEHRTAPMAWSLSPSRQGWLLWRTGPLIVLLLIALLVLGQASEVLLQTVEQRELGFRHFGMSGPILAARGVAVFGVGVFVGLALGRVLPAILVTALATAAIASGTSIGRDLLMREEAVWMPMDQQADVQMVFDQGFQSDATGDVITWDVAYTRYPDAFDDMTAEGAPPGMSPVWKIVRPDTVGLYVAREIGVLTGVFAVAVGASVALVRRRRPG